MPPTNAQTTELIARLAITPAQLAQAVAGKTPEKLQQRSTHDNWSASEILAHMRAADEIMASRIPMLLARDTPSLVAFDERRWGEVAAYVDVEFHLSLRLFTLRRAEIVAMLRRLPTEAWLRSGLHETHGKQSILMIVQDMVAHEDEHCTQLETLFQT